MIIQDRFLSLVSKIIYPASFFPSKHTPKAKDPKEDVNIFCCGNAQAPHSNSIKNRFDLAAPAYYDKARQFSLNSYAAYIKDELLNACRNTEIKNISIRGWSMGGAALAIALSRLSDQEKNMLGEKIQHITILNTFSGLSRVITRMPLTMTIIGLFFLPLFIIDPLLTVSKHLLFSIPYFLLLPFSIHHLPYKISSIYHQGLKQTLQPALSAINYAFNRLLFMLSPIPLVTNIAVIPCLYGIYLIRGIINFISYALLTSFTNAIFKNLGLRKPSLPIARLISDATSLVLKTAESYLLNISQTCNVALATLICKRLDSHQDIKDCVEKIRKSFGTRVHVYQSQHDLIVPSGARIQDRWSNDPKCSYIQQDDQENGHSYQLNSCMSGRI